MMENGMELLIDQRPLAVTHKTLIEHLSMSRWGGIRGTRQVVVMLSLIIVHLSVVFMKMQNQAPQPREKKNRFL